MNEYEITVNFGTGVADNKLLQLVQNDYNSTKLKFIFDDSGDRVLFKMLFPDGKDKYVAEVENEEVILGPGLLSQEGWYQIELSRYYNDGRLTAYATLEFYVREELIDTDEPIEHDDRLPILDTLINEVDNIDIDATKEDSVTTVTITKKDGTEKSVEIYDGSTGITVFEIENGHLIAIAESIEDCERYEINDTDGHLYLEIGDD